MPEREFKTVVERTFTHVKTLFSPFPTPPAGCLVSGQLFRRIRGLDFYHRMGNAAEYACI